jgi:hypothetical protein
MRGKSSILKKIISCIPKMHQKLLILFVLFGMIILSGCDIDRYIGYRTKGQPLIEYATIHGVLINKFTDDPVYGAHIVFGGLETYSGSNGDYQFIFPLTDNENRSKPVDVNIMVENYFPYHAQREVYPDLNEFNFTLTYAAPIIYDAARVADNKQFPFYYVQAVIRDYQGLGNIRKVTGIFPYAGKYEGKTEYRQQLTLLEADPLSSNTGHYQCQIPFEAPYKNIFYIEVVDWDGYSDKIQHAIDEMTSPEKFLFSPF